MLDVKIKIDKITEDKEKKYFHVSAEIGTQRSRSVSFKTKNIIFPVEEVLSTIKGNCNVSDLEFLSAESLTELKHNSHRGVCVFKKKGVDIIKESVRIEPQIEAETPLVEESEPEASLFSEPLPYGLKSTAKKTTAKKKKTTKKKTTEE